MPDDQPKTPEPSSADSFLTWFLIAFGVGMSFLAFTSGSPKAVTAALTAFTVALGESLWAWVTGSDKIPATPSQSSASEDS